MCVVYNASCKGMLRDIKEQVSRGKNKGWIAIWKSVRLNGQPLICFSKPTRYDHKGWVYALDSRDKPITNKYPYSFNNNAGIHGYRDRKSMARRINRKKICVWVYYEDIIAIDDRQLAASRVFNGTLKEAKESLAQERKNEKA